MTEITVTEIDKGLIHRYSNPLHIATAVFVICKKTDETNDDTRVIRSHSLSRIIVYDDDSIAVLQGEIDSKHTLHQIPKE